MKTLERYKALLNYTEQIDTGKLFYEYKDRYNKPLIKIYSSKYYLPTDSDYFKIEGQGIYYSEYEAIKKGYINNAYYNK